MVNTKGSHKKGKRVVLGGHAITLALIIAGVGAVVDSLIIGSISILLGWLVFFAALILASILKWGFLVSVVDAVESEE